MDENDFVLLEYAKQLNTEALSAHLFDKLLLDNYRGYIFFSTQLMSRIERLRAFCSILRDTCEMTEISLHIDPSRVLPYHADKAYWTERDFRLVVKVFMENKLFPSHVIVYVAAMWGYTDYADQLVKDSGSENAGDLKAYMYHGAGMRGDVFFKAQEMGNDLREFERYYFSGQLANDPDNNVHLLDNVMLSMVYMSGLICRGRGLSSEGRQRVAGLLSWFNNIPECRERATDTALFAALLSGDTEYADALRPSREHEETVGSREWLSAKGLGLELLAALQMRHQEKAWQLLEVFLTYDQPYFSVSCFLECAVRQQLDVFVQAYLDRGVGYSREEAIKCILRKGSDDFIARLRLGDTADALENLNQEKETALRHKRWSFYYSFFYSFSPFEKYVMHLDARRGLQLRYGPDTDIDAIYIKADHQAYARVMQQQPRRSEEMRVQQNLSVTLVLCAGLVLAVSAVCAMANTSGMRLLK